MSQIMDHSVTIEENRDVLLRCVNINVHIIACLRAAEVIDQAMESRLEAEKAPYDKLCLLIDWIKKSPYVTYESFIKVMKENEQEHVANLFEGNKETKHAPLSIEKHARLVKIRQKLMRMIHNNVSLIAELISLKAISEIDAEDLTADKGPNYKKNFRLINAVLRRSDYSFECLCDALRNCHHPDAADYLIKGEVIALHVNTTRSDLDESLTESLNDTFVKESMDETTPKELEMPQLNGLRIVGAYPGHSIVILIYCKTTENVVTFTQLFNSGDLQSYLQHILNHHFRKIEPESTEKLEARIGLDDEEVLAVEEITGIEDWMEKQGGRRELPTEPFCASDSPGEEKMAHENLLGAVKPTLFFKRAGEEKMAQKIILASSRELHWRRERRAIYEGKRYLGFGGRPLYEYERHRRLGRRALYKEEEDERYWDYEGSDFDEDELYYNYLGLGRRRAYEDERYWEYKGREFYDDDLYLSFNDETLCWRREKRRASLQTIKSLMTEKETLFNRLLRRKTKSKQDELPQKLKSDPILVTEIQGKAIHVAEKEIIGLAILDNKLFVLGQRSSAAEVYDSMTFSFCCKWSVIGVVDPQDIVSCNNNKCLYILENVEFHDPSNNIWRFDPNGLIIRKWSTTVDFGDSLSVTEESNVILVVHNKNKLNEYSPDGHLIREINLSSDAGIFHPWHSVKLTSGNFLVSHGFGFFDQHRVAIVDGDGKLKKSFGGNRGSAIGQMNIPFHFAVDANGFILVVDRFNSRILLLDPDLQFKREIISKEKNGIRDPRRILLDESNGRLLVADNKWNNGRILVFPLQLTVSKITSLNC